MDHIERHSETDQAFQPSAVFGWTVTFLLIALIAAALGFGGVDGTAAKAAQVIFAGALVAFTMSACAGFWQDRFKK